MNFKKKRDLLSWKDKEPKRRKEPDIDQKLGKRMKERMLHRVPREKTNPDKDSMTKMMLKKITDLV